MMPLSNHSTKKQPGRRQWYKRRNRAQTQHMEEFANKQAAEERSETHREMSAIAPQSPLSKTPNIGGSSPLEDSLKRLSKSPPDTMQQEKDNLSHPSSPASGVGLSRFFGWAANKFTERNP